MRAQATGAESKTGSWYSSGCNQTPNAGSLIIVEDVNGLVFFLNQFPGTFPAVVLEIMFSAGIC